MSAVSILQAAKILNLSPTVLRRKSTRNKYGIKNGIRPPFCLDDRLVFFTEDSVAAAATLIQATKEMRGAAQSPTPPTL